MQNHYPSINRDLLHCNRGFISECLLLLRRTLPQKNTAIADKLKNIAQLLVAALTVGGIFLAGMYFFLIQLAGYGW